MHTAASRRRRDAGHPHSPAALSQEPELVGMAVDMLDEVLHRDPAHAAAHALAGWCWALGANHCLTRDPEGDRARASEHCRRALALSPDGPEIMTLSRSQAARAVPRSRPEVPFFAAAATIDRSDPTRAPSAHLHGCKSRWIANTLPAQWPDRPAIWEIPVSLFMPRATASASAALQADLSVSKHFRGADYLPSTRAFGEHANGQHADQVRRRRRV